MPLQCKQAEEACWVVPECLGHSSAMMNGCLQCACYASSQDLQPSLQEQREVRADLLCTARLLTVTNGSFPQVHTCRKS